MAFSVPVILQIESMGWLDGRGVGKVEVGKGWDGWEAKGGSKQPFGLSVKADLAIYGQVLGVSRW